MGVVFANVRRASIKTFVNNQPESTLFKGRSQTEFLTGKPNQGFSSAKILLHIRPEQFVPKRKRKVDSFVLLINLVERDFPSEANRDRTIEL